MKKLTSVFEQIAILKYTLKWLLLALPVAASVGSMVALFLFLLEQATQFRWQHQWLLYLLPFAGIAIVLLYQLKGKNADAGNNLIMEEINSAGKGIPFRMGPFILLTTVVTHLFGGSAGREGTAVQIGGSLANYIATKLKLTADDTRILLMTGIAAGFGAVFGTPITGAVFALEVLAIGRIKYDALLPCLFAAVLADVVCSAYGIQHTHYHLAFHEKSASSFPFFHADLFLLAKVALAGVAFGLVGFLFSEALNTVKNLSNRFISNKYLVPFIGGILIVGLSFIGHNSDYLGLGVKTASGSGASIVNAFESGGVEAFSWLWKLVFTVVTLGMGFKGGEVTPLFFIGAALGNSLACVLGAPIDLIAALGFVAVFAGATNTPLACTLMGVELFGGTNVMYFAVACFLSYYFSGHSGIYSSQKISVFKAGLGNEHTNSTSLKQIREKRIARYRKPK